MRFHWTLPYPLLAYSTSLNPFRSLLFRLYDALFSAKYPLTSRTKDIYATELLYVIGTALVKFSILSLYSQIFGVSQRFRFLVGTVGALISAHLVIAFFMALFQCRPINGAWDGNVKATCMNVELWSLVIGVVNVCLEFGVLLLPISMVWGVQMKLRWKVQVSGMFMLGACESFLLHYISSARVDYERQVTSANHDL